MNVLHRVGKEFAAHHLLSLLQSTTSFPRAGETVLGHLILCTLCTFFMFMNHFLTNTFLHFHKLTSLSVSNDGKSQLTSEKYKERNRGDKEGQNVFLTLCYL